LDIGHDLKVKSRLLSESTILFHRNSFEFFSSLYFSKFSSSLLSEIQVMKYYFSLPIGLSSPDSLSIFDSLFSDISDSVPSPCSGNKEGNGLIFEKYLLHENLL